MQKGLKDLRKEIDALDRQLILPLGKRMLLSKSISLMKKDKGIDLRQPEREAELVALQKELALEPGLNPDFAERLFKLLLEESLSVQRLKQKE